MMLLLYLLMLHLMVISECIKRKKRTASFLDHKSFALVSSLDHPWVLDNPVASNKHHQKYCN